MSFWDETPSPTTRQLPDIVEADPIGVVTSSALARTDGGWLGELVKLAHDLPARDMDVVRVEAARVGAELGRILDSDPDSQGCAAYYRWEQGGNVIEGPTADLMEALSGVYGRIVSDISITEERGRRVTFTVQVADLLALVIKRRPFVSTLAPAPGKFANKHDQRERWDTIQLQSAISKGERSVTERVIPRDVIEIALDAARKASAAERLDAANLSQGVSKVLAAFGRLDPVPPLELLERWVGKPRADWTSYDLQALRSPYARLVRGELTPDGFVAEAAAREAERLAGGPAETTAPSTDRLSGLGLGNPAAPSGGAGGLASGEASSSAAPAAETKRTNVGEDLDALVRALEQAGGPVTVDLARERFKLLASVGRLTAARWDPIVALGLQLGRIEQENGWLRLPKTDKPHPIADPPAVDVAAMSLGDLQEQCRWHLAELSDDQARDALRTAAIPTIDGATAPALANLLTILRARAAGGAS